MRAQRARLLVVDDEAMNRRLLEGYLRSEGHLVSSAPDGPTALRMAGQEPPDLVLLDVMMPGMSGYEVCRELKRSAKTRLCQVMLVTALGGSHDKIEGLDHGADDHVAKPVRRDEFLAKVRACLRARNVILELERARAQLAARNEELELKKALAQSLVHDLKNPLTTILGNLDLLKLQCGEQAAHLVQRSRKGAERMLAMVLDLLDVEGLEQGRLQPALEPADVALLARASIEEAQVSAEQKGVSVELHAPDPAWVVADASLLRRVVDNLLANAVSHAPEATVVEIEVETCAEGVRIAVSDQGCGVPEAHRERVFEKYAQVELRRAGVTSNRGLGLTFCRLAVEAHGGTIWVEPSSTGGACFQALLPAAMSPIAEVGVQEARLAIRA